jgi:hypothetical protein
MKRHRYFTRANCREIGSASAGNAEVGYSRRSGRAARNGESGYALLLVVFLLAILVTTVMMATPRTLTEGRREKEQEMIWRGKQYINGIKRYTLKNGHLPTSLDDLMKAGPGSVRFMRKAYTDPMNTKEDGKWRLIYVGPAGNLIGSHKPPQTIQFQGAGGLGTPAAAVAAGSQNGPPAQLPSAFGASPGTSSGGILTPGGASSTPAAGIPAAAGATGSGAPGAVAVDADGMIPTGDANGLSGASSSDATIIGGKIIGVGSNVKHPSVIVYEKARNYWQFEFVWDPSKDAAGGVGVPPGAGVNPGGRCRLAVHKAGAATPGTVTPPAPNQ